MLLYVVRKNRFCSRRMPRPISEEFTVLGLFMSSFLVVRISGTWLQRLSMLSCRKKDPLQHQRFLSTVDKMVIFSKKRDLFSLGMTSAYRNTNLTHCITFTQSGSVRLFQRIKIDGNSKWYGNFIGAGVAATDGSA